MQHAPSWRSPSPRNVQPRSPWTKFSCPYFSFPGVNQGDSLQTNAVHVGQPPHLTSTMFASVDWHSFMSSKSSITVAGGNDRARRSRVRQATMSMACTIQSSMRAIDFSLNSSMKWAWIQEALRWELRRKRRINTIKLHWSWNIIVYYSRQL